MITIMKQLQLSTCVPFFVIILPNSFNYDVTFEVHQISVWQLIKDGVRINWPKYTIYHSKIYV